MFSSFTIIYFMYKIFIFYWIFFNLTFSKVDMASLWGFKEVSYFTFDMLNDIEEETKETEEKETEFKKLGFSGKKQAPFLTTDINTTNNFSRILIYICDLIFLLLVDDLGHINM